MPPSIVKEAGLKRKAHLSKHAEPQPKRRRRLDEKDGFPGQVEALEDGVKRDSKNLNNVALLLNLFAHKRENSRGNILVTEALCRVFSRLFAAGKFAEASNSEDVESQTVHMWLTRRYEEYHKMLITLLRDSPKRYQPPALNMFMHILSEEMRHTRSNVWHSTHFSNFLLALLDLKDGSDIRKDFAKQYMCVYIDCCYHSMEWMINLVPALDNQRLHRLTQEILVHLHADQIISGLTADGRLFGSARVLKKAKISAGTLKRQGETLWRVIFSNPNLDGPLRKMLIGHTNTLILPWLKRPESLMDLLTDTYDTSDASTALLALSGLYQLISTKNLDYPSFYPKLYSLITASALHSKSRSRLLRHLDKFLSSTHLPASLIASFIKRLSRLALFAPPAAIVAIVPYIYNVLKAHPACTFMIHRPPHPPYTPSSDPADLATDPFLPLEPDPQKTNAIASSLWEIETLQSHYHPNVAAIARIISEQFTKQQYNLEDFLDLGYASMLESELGREVKRPAVVEWKIPKHVLLKPKGGEDTGEDLTLLQRLWEFG